MERSSRGAGHLFFHAQSAIFDTLVIDPCAKSYVKAAKAPLDAATIGETKSAASMTTDASVRITCFILSLSRCLVAWGFEVVI